jgi:hemerythrin-like domain-containing protein
MSLLMGMLTNIDFKGGEILFDDFDIDFSKPFSEQLYSLKEDLFQVNYSNGDTFTIDIGWYPEMEIEGNFITYVIKNFNWEKPLFKEKSKNHNKLVQDLKNAIEVVEKIKKSKIKSL